MQIPKQQIIDMLRNKGKDDEADKADANLPDTVDHEEHADLLKEHGVDPQEVAGGAGEKLGL